MNIKTWIPKILEAAERYCQKGWQRNDHSVTAQSSQVTYMKIFNISKKGTQILSKWNSTWERLFPLERIMEISTRNTVTTFQNIQSFNEHSAELGSEIKKNSARHRTCLFRVQSLMGETIKLIDILCKVLETRQDKIYKNAYHSP